MSRVFSKGVDTETRLPVSIACVVNETEIVMNRLGSVESIAWMSEEWTTFFFLHFLFHSLSFFPVALIQISWRPSILCVSSSVRILQACWMCKNVFRIHLSKEHSNKNRSINSKLNTLVKSRKYYLFSTIYILNITTKIVVFHYLTISFETSVLLQLEKYPFYTDIIPFRIIIGWKKCSPISDMDFSSKFLSW